jgi:urease accessory protein
MRRATKIKPAGTWNAAQARDRITLAFEDRFRRRVRLTADGGLDFLLDLPEAAVLRAGDGIELEDGGIVLVRAAEENLIEISAADAGALARLAWHIGNRHLPAEIGAGRILIRDDHVIVDMLRGLGAATRPVKAPFNPEGGAYGQHNHDQRHPHGHSHAR